MKRMFTAVAAGVVTVMSLGAGVATSYANTEVDMIVDGQRETLYVWGDSVQDALDAGHIDLSSDAEVTPSPSERITDGTQVVVKYLRPLTLIIDGVTKTFWTTATTVEDALEEIGMHDRSIRISVDRSAPLGREGLTITATTPKTIKLTVAGESTDTESSAATVGGLLHEMNVIVGANDRVSPSLDTALTSDMEVVVNRVELSELSETQPVKFNSISTDDPALPKGVKKITTEGVPGEKTVTYEVTTVDGTEESRTLRSEEITKEPVDEKVSVGTKITSYSGSHADWMSAANIPESDWSAAEILINRESGWNPRAVNSATGACGLVQSLPCSKLGPNWDDPIVALKWGNQYVKSRYGGWQQALAHSNANGWY